MNARRIILLVALLAVAMLVWEFRVALLEALFTLAAGRFVFRRAWPRRRRPKASWAKNAEALALLIAAWSTRGLVRPKGLRRRPYSFAAVGGRFERRRPHPPAPLGGPGDEVPF